MTEYEKVMRRLMELESETSKAMSHSFWRGFACALIGVTIAKYFSWAYL